jgi:hypothetical protein
VLDDAHAVAHEFHRQPRPTARRVDAFLDEPDHSRMPDPLESLDFAGEPPPEARPEVRSLEDLEGDLFRPFLLALAPSRRKVDPCRRSPPDHPLERPAADAPAEVRIGRLPVADLDLVGDRVEQAAQSIGERLRHRGNRRESLRPPPRRLVEQATELLEFPGAGVETTVGFGARRRRPFAVGRSHARPFRDDAGGPKRKIPADCRENLGSRIP